MKRIAVMVMVLFATFSGCAVLSENTGETITPRPASEMRFPKDFDKVWDAAMKTIPDLPIIRKDKASGQIVSNWKNLKKTLMSKLSNNPP